MPRSRRPRQAQGNVRVIQHRALEALRRRMVDPVRLGARYGGRSMSWQCLSRSSRRRHRRRGSRGIPWKLRHGPWTLARAPGLGPGSSLVADLRVAAARRAAADGSKPAAAGSGCVRRGRPWRLLSGPRSSASSRRARSTPGRPLYGLRLGLESLLLPASDTPERLDAQHHSARAVLVEAESRPRRPETRPRHPTRSPPTGRSSVIREPNWLARMAFASARSWLATRSSWPDLGPICRARQSRRPMRRSTR